MAKPSKKSRRNKASPPAVELAPRLAPRRTSAERRLRILERLTSGLTVAHIARIENLTVHRIRQIIAGMLEKRELDPPAGFVQLQIARLSEAMIVARTMMMEGDLQAMDRMIKLTGELDRYHGFASSRFPAPAEAASPRLAAAPPPAMLSAPDGGQGKFSSSQDTENARNRAIFIPALVGEDG
ncbi:MAG TPA: hypothetical protein VGL41_04575 [Roseiarcus sp.]|jgi:hypothetical protein